MTTLDRIFARYYNNLSWPEETFKDALIAWADARATAYAEKVREACAQQFARESIVRGYNCRVLVREAPLPPIDEVRP